MVTTARGPPVTPARCHKSSAVPADKWDGSTGVVNIDELPAGPQLDGLVAGLMGDTRNLPRAYSTDLDLAWTLAARLAHENIQVELSIRRDHDESGRMSHLACCTREPDLSFTMACDATSPAAAICRAALKMQQEPVPDLLLSLEAQGKA